MDGRRIGLLENRAAQGEAADIGRVSCLAIYGKLFARQQLRLRRTDEHIGPIISIGVLDGCADGKEEIGERSLSAGTDCRQEQCER